MDVGVVVVVMMMKAPRLSSFVRHGLDNTLTAHSTAQIWWWVLRDRQQRARGSSGARRKAASACPRSFQAVVHGCTHTHAPVALSGATSQRRHSYGQPAAYPSGITSSASASPCVAVDDGNQAPFRLECSHRCDGAGCPRRHARARRRAASHGGLNAMQQRGRR